MDEKLRKLHAMIGYLGLPKKVLARYVGVSRPLFSMYLNGDVNMPAEIENRLMNRIAAEFKTLHAKADDPPLLQETAP
jgi:hypothetical protein